MPVAEEYEYPGALDFGVGLNVDEANEQMINSNQVEGDLSEEPEKYKQPVVGIIYPPPEVRNIVDKTASFVARNGPEFESRIKLNEQNNSKFNFLSNGDPYHAYYQHKVREIQEGKLPATAAQSASVEVPFQKLQLDEAKKKRQSELLKQVELPFIPRESPNDFEYISDPPSIAAIDLDIVKLTALFVARNGRQFLSSLMTREQRNYQFDFLRPQHSLFQYFTKLLEQYTKVLIPPKDIVKKLMSDERKRILDDVKYRANWIKHQEAVKKKEEEASEKERMAYACIDWHDFVVVETVDYQPYESGHFPPPTNPQEVGARVLMQDRILLGEIEPDKNKVGDDESLAAQDDIQVQDMDEESSSSEDEDQPQKSDHGGQMLPPIAESLSQDHVIIKKGYDPKQAKATQEKVVRPMPGSGYTISPITGERIPVSKVAEHFRIGLLDPRWKEQRDRQLQEKANQESVFAPGSAIEDSLKQLADRRSDIFGVGVEETPIGKKVDEREPGRPWDPSAEIHIISRAGNMPGGDDNSDMIKDKNETIGPSLNKGSVISSGPQPPSSSGGMQHQHPPQGPPPQLSTISGIIRPNPPPMLMRPLLGHPGHPGGFPPFPPMHRQPLLPPHMLPPPPHHHHHQQQQQHQQQPPPPQQQQQQMMSLLNPIYGDDEPVAKKAKNLEDSLVDEVTFLATNPPTSQFSVALPGGKPEMNLHGQLLSFTLPLTDSVTSLKSKISEAIGLAASKQKLRLIEGLFFKDTNSLAFYNIGNGATVHLSLKERGGRKK